MILFYARFARRSGMRRAANATALFVSAYLAIWALFSLAAALLRRPWSAPAPPRRWSWRSATAVS